MVFIDFALKSGQTTSILTCALKNWYENLPDWLGKYVGMIVKGEVFIFFFLTIVGSQKVTLWVIMFFGDMQLRDDHTDSWELINNAYFAMKIQISRLSDGAP